MLPSLSPAHLIHQHVACTRLAHSLHALRTRCLPAACARAQSAEVKPSLVAFLAYISDKIAGVAVRERGHRTHREVQGDLRDRSEWNQGIHKALKFIKDRKQCPTVHPLISAIQKKHRA